MFSVVLSNKTTREIKAWYNIHDDNMRKALYEIIETGENREKANKIYAVCMTVCIICNLIPLAFKEDTQLLQLIDKVTVTVFIIDYILRLYTADYKYSQGVLSFIRYPFSPMAIKKDNFSIKCGFVGAPLLCTVLGEAGRTDLAYDFLLKEDFPSWLYCVNLGATTIWERWNSVGPDGTISDTGMNSLNHYSYGSVMEFVYAYAAGIRPAEPGFRKAVIAPNPDYRLPHLECSFDSAAGKYVSNTSINSDGTVTIHIEIPFGCEAEVTLPRSGKDAETLAAGTYDFTYEPSKDFRKPFDETTPIVKLGENEQAAGILFGLVPPIGGMAKGRDAEFGYNGLADFRYLTFLPFEPDKLEEAIKLISDLVVE